MSIAAAQTVAAHASSTGYPIMHDVRDNEARPGDYSETEDGKDSHDSGASVEDARKYYYADDHSMTDDNLHAVRSALKTQADMLTHSVRGLDLPFVTSATEESPFDVPSQVFRGADAAEYHSALLATRSDPDTQRALRESQTLLRNRFRHPTKMGDSRSHILQDMDFLLSSWSDHTDGMRYYEDRAERLTATLIESGTGCSREDREECAWWAKKAMFHKACAMDQAKLYVGAKKALNALVPDEADCEGEVYQITSDC